MANYIQLRISDGNWKKKLKDKIKNDNVKSVKNILDKYETFSNSFVSFAISFNT